MKRSKYGKLYENCCFINTFMQQKSKKENKQKKSHSPAHKFLAKTVFLS